MTTKREPSSMRPHAITDNTGIAYEELSAEQKARDMLERMGVKDAQSFTAGELVELANLLAARDALRKLGRAVRGKR